jgi:TolA-binding protein
MPRQCRDDGTVAHVSQWEDTIERSLTSNSFSHKRITCYNLIRTTLLHIMTTQTKQPAFGTPRNQDELEGTLLLPTATAVMNTVVLGAVPTQHFEYAQVVASIPEQEMMDISDLPTAPLVPKYDNLKSREQIASQKKAIGELRGFQQAELEKEQIARADRETFAINYHANRQVQLANENARRRDMHGAEIQKDTWFGKEKDHKMEAGLAAAAPTTTTEPAFATPKDGGYEVAEYQFGGYAAGSDYEVSEYKSVYD